MDRILPSRSRSLRRSQVIKLLRESNKLPVLPAILRNLETMLADPDVNTVHVADLIESEPVIGARVLKLANSALYGGGRRTLDSVALAVNRLGFRTVRTLVYSSALPDLFPSIENFDHHQFWRHSLTVAMLSRDLMTRSPDRTMKAVDQAYLAGLMHGVGVLAFYTLMPEEYAAAITQTRDTAGNLIDVEHELFGLSHPELGAILVESEWEMDDVIVSAVKHQYDPPSRTSQRTVRETLFVANSVCLVYGISNGTGMNYSQMHLELLATLGRLGYDQEAVERLLDLANREVDTIEAMLSEN